MVNIPIEIGTLSYMEVQAAEVACSALLSVAVEARGVFWIQTINKNLKKSQQVSKSFKELSR